MILQRPPLIATLFLLIGLSILVSLGTWQLQRLAWKTDLLAQIDAAYIGDAPLLSSADLNEAKHLTRANIAGRYLTEKSFLIGPRTYQWKIGAHVITPFVMESNHTLLVNRGWILQGSAIPQAPRGFTNLTGLLRLPEATNSFTPDNVPEAGAWYHINLLQIADHFALNKLAPVILYAQSNINDDKVIGHNEKPQLKNNHLGYAIFWYSLGLTLIVIFVLRFMIRRD